MKKTLLFVAALASMAMNVFAAGEVITFDINQPANPSKIVFNENNIWEGTYDETINYLDFNEGAFSFSHLPSGASYGGQSYEGFTISQIYDANLKQGEACYAKGSSKGENTPYMVGYDSHYYDANNGNTPTLTATHILYPNGGYAKSVKLALTAQVVDAVTNPLGDLRPGSTPFAQGDFFVITFTGIDENFENIPSKRVDAFLVDYRAKDQAKWVFEKGWVDVDLSSLGQVYGVNIKVMSTKMDQWGVTTPTYFCLDELQFSTEPISTDVEEVEVAPVKAYAQNGILNIQAEGAVAVYNLMGVQVFAADLNGETAQVALNAGIYVVRAGDQAVKVQVR